MKKEITLFIINIAIIVLSAIALLVTSLLFEINFIQQHFSRQLIIYIIMAIEAFIFIRIILLLNNDVVRKWK